MEGLERAPSSYQEIAFSVLSEWIIQVKAFFASSRSDHLKMNRRKDPTLAARSDGEPFKKTVQPGPSSDIALDACRRKTRTNKSYPPSNRSLTFNSMGHITRTGQILELRPVTLPLWQAGISLERRLRDVGDHTVSVALQKARLPHRPDGVLGRSLLLRLW